jgi:hypothetical protein
MPSSNNTSFHKTSMGCGIRHKFLCFASSNAIFIPGESDTEVSEVVHTSNHPMLTVPDIDSPSSNIFGIEKVFNYTTNEDITDKIIRTTSIGIFFYPDKVKSTDIIELTVYTNATAWDDRETIDGVWVEQLFRHSTHLDRMDFGSWTPPFEWSLDQSDYDALGWAYHQRLFYNFGGWYHEDDRVSSSITAGDPINENLRTILSWSPNSPTTIGTFVGDPALNTAKSVNDKFTVQPIPFYLTGLTFYCKMKNTTYDTTKGSAVQLSISIDGVNDVMSSSPKYELSSGEREIKSKFGDDNKFYASMSSEMEYGGLTPAYKYGRQMDSTDFNIIHKRIGCRARSLDIAARVVGEDADWDKIEEWYLTVSGMIMYGYDTS